MRRHLQLQQNVTKHRFNEQSWAIELVIAHSMLVDIICELALLVYDRSQQLSLILGDGNKLILSIGEVPSTINSSDENPLVLTLSQRDAEFIFCFLLTWYRDGLAEVSHIDIDLVGSPSDGQDCTLVIKAEHFQPLMRGDEAARMLREIE